MQQCVPVSIQTPFRFLPAILNNTKWQWHVEEAGGETKNLVADLTSQRFSFLTEGGLSLFYSIFGSRQSREETSAWQERCREVAEHGGGCSPAGAATPGARHP